MTNILIEGEHIPSYDMTIIAFERFSKLLPINIRPVLTRSVSRSDLKWCDIYICVRGNNPLRLYLCKQAKKQGCKVILMLDDDLLSYNSNEHPLYEKICKRSLLSIIKLSDIILTPSEYLGNKYGIQFGKNYVVTNTAIDREDIKDNWYRSDRIRLLYAAGHMYNFEQQILPILSKLYGRYNDKISLTIIGGKIKAESIKMPITFLDSMPYHEYREYMKNHSFDIGFAPLYETEMVKSKYFNKYLEYSTQGICGIYSNNLPYAAIVKDSVNGLLAQNTPESWFAATCSLVDDPILRERCVKYAQSELINRFSINNIIKQLCSDIPWLATFKRQKKDNFILKLPSYPLFLIQELIRRSLKLFV